MPQKFEYYDVNDDSFAYIYNVNWAGQTFTPSTAHNITSVKLKLFRVGNPGTLTVGIRATDVNGIPTGEDLTTGTIDGNTLTTNTAGEWYEIALSAHHLSATIKVAIVGRAPDAPPDESAYVGWRIDTTQSTYPGGWEVYSYDSGSSWNEYTSRDYMFEEWGTLPASLLNPGYWHSTYWARGYWNPLYWPRYGTVTPPPTPPVTPALDYRRKGRIMRKPALSDEDVHLALLVISAYERRRTHAH